MYFVMTAAKMALAGDSFVVKINKNQFSENQLSFKICQNQQGCSSCPLTHFLFPL